MNLGNTFWLRHLLVISFSSSNLQVSSFASSQYQKRKNPQIEQFAHEAKAETNKRKLEIVELKRLEHCQHEKGAQS